VQWIHRQGHGVAVEDGGEGLGKTGTLGQHDQDSITGSDVELSQHPQDGDRALDQCGRTHPGLDSA